MSTELERLIVELDAKTAKYNRDMKKSAKVTQDSTNKMGKQLEKMSGKQDKAGKSMGDFKVKAIATAIAITAIGVKIINVARKFEVYDAQLKTATGSTEAASEALEALQDFAATTPFSIEQSITAFTKLRNLGLDPGEAALTSYGNTAVAMGKDLNQMIEAVADAATGEFERLKEFGIKAKTEGDKVAFAFQGQTVTIGKNAKEITEFLQGIGDVNFAGAMEEQFNTLDGFISNFGDNVDKLFVAIAKSGLSDVVKDLFTVANAELADFTTRIDSGEIEANLKLVFSKFDGFGEDLAGLFDSIGSLWATTMDEMGSDAEITSDDVTNTFKNMPENIRAFIQILVVEILSAFDFILADAEFFADSVAAIFTDDTIEAAAERQKQAYKNIESTRNSSISSILTEKDAAINSFDEQIEKSKDLTTQFLADREERRKASEEAGGLSRFAIQVEEGEETLSPEERKTQKTLDDSIQKKLDEIEKRQTLQDEADQNIVEALEARLETETNLVSEAVERELLTKEEAIERKKELDQEYQEGLIELAETNLEKLTESIDLELELHQELLDKKLISEEEFQNRVSQTNNKGVQDRIKLAQKEAVSKSGLENATLNTGIKAIEVFGQRSNKAARAAFEIKKIQKGSEAVVSTAAGVAEALPNIPLAIATGIFGAAQIAAIASQSFEGGGSSGGSVGAPSVDSQPIESEEPSITSDLEVDETIITSAGSTSSSVELEFTADSGDQIGEAMAELINNSVKNGKVTGQT